MSQKKCMRLEGCEIKSMRPIFKTEMLIYQSKANLDEKILFFKIAHQLDSEIKKTLVSCMFGNKNSTFHSDPWFTFYWNSKSVSQTGNVNLNAT